MAERKKLRAGLENLIGGADQHETHEEEQQTQSETQTEEQQQPQTEEAHRGGLFDGITDEELRIALEEIRNVARKKPRKGKPTQAEEYIRFCAFVKKQNIAKLKGICLREGLTIKEVLNEMLSVAIETYERKYGKIVSKTHKGDVSKLFK